ncbi:MAG: hypothetical protein WCI12_06800 [Actinomycetes bacterium]
MISSFFLFLLVSIMVSILIMATMGLVAVRSAVVNFLLVIPSVLLRLP